MSIGELRKKRCYKYKLSQEVINMKFCEQCGRKLEDGAPCACQDPATQASIPPPPPIPAVTNQTAQMPPPPPPIPVVTNQTAQMPPPPPAPVFEGICLHCGFQMGDGIMFCGQCGKKAGTAPPPKPRKFCQGCGNELPDGLKFCQICGQQVPGMSFNIGNVTGGGSIKIPVSIDEAKGFVGGLKINLQRIAIAGASLLGILCLLMPMISLKGEGKAYATEIRYMVDTRWMGDSVGWIVLAFFIAPIVISLLGNRERPLGKLKYACIPCGAIVALIDIMNLVSIRDIISSSYLDDYTRIGFSMFLILIPAAALCAIPFIKKLES